MVSDAVSKLKDEIDKNKNNSYIQAVGNYLISYLNQNPGAAEKILNPDKNIAKSLDEMRKVAEKKKDGNYAVLAPQEGFDIVMKYFGIDKKFSTPATAATVTTSTDSSASDFKVSLDDLL